jgi:hypothetical protein
VEIDNDAMDVQLEREAGAIGLVLNIPIRRVKTEAEASEALAVMHAVQSGEAISGSVPALPIDPPTLVETLAVEPAPLPTGDEPTEVPSPEAAVEEAEGVLPEPFDAAPTTDAADVAKEEMLEAASVSSEPAVKPTPLRLPGARVTASVPVRALGYTKANGDTGLLGSSAGAETASPSKETEPEDSDATETRPLVRDAWYSAELLHVMSSERQEPSD